MLQVMSNIREKNTHSFKQAGLQHIFTVLPEVQALYTFSLSHPPAQMISFQQRSSMQKNSTSYLVNSKKNIIQGKIEMSGLHLCTTQLFQL